MSQSESHGERERERERGRVDGDWSDDEMACYI
jgi:hypothetical protein